MDIAWIAAQFPDLIGLQLLARGGQKIVFSANHSSEGEIVLKLLAKASGERLERELLAGQLVECERIPRVYETGSLSTPVGDYIWLRECRVQGITLRDTLSNGALDFRVVVRLGTQLLSALAQAETKRIVHRDIKPENIMVDNGGDFWLLDFGLARHLDLESLTATRHPFGVGTPGYSAPEQMRNWKQAIDGRADLFSVGVLLHECATGTNPFLDGARDILEILHRVESSPLPRLQIEVDIGEEFADFVSTLVQKYPSRRPRTVAEALTWMLEVASRHGAIIK